MEKTATKMQHRNRRHARIRATISGTAQTPRLAVFRSNRYVYAQLIDDEKHVTLVAVDSRKQSGATLQERAKAVGKIIAEGAKAKKIEKIVFDRGGFKYQGVIAALADGARDNGLQF